MKATIIDVCFWHIPHEIYSGKRRPEWLAKITIGGATYNGFGRTQPQALLRAAAAWEADEKATEEKE